MPIFLAALLGGLLSVAGSVVGRVLIALSIGYVSYTGISIGLGAIATEIQGYLTGAPATIVQVMYLFKVDVIVSILVSAITARLVLNGLTSGTLSRMVIKP